jgi:O-antigen ligase
MRASRSSALFAAPLSHAPSGTAPTRAPGWDLLLVSVAAYILASIGRVHQLYAFLLPLKPALVGGILAITLYAFGATGARRPDTLWTGPTKYTFLILLWIAFSIPGALWQSASFLLLTDDFIKTAVMFVVILGAVRTFADVERLSVVYFLSAVIYAWVVFTRFGPDAGRNGGLVYYDANDFAVFEVTALPIGMYLLVGQKRAVLRAVGAVGIALLLITFVRTGSRGGFLALLGAGVFFFFGYGSIRTAWRVVGVAAGVILFSMVASESYWERMRTIMNPKDDYNYTSETGRWKIWKRGVGYMVTNPVFGVGANNFSTAEGRLSGIAAELQSRNIGMKWSTAHNSFVQIGAELGVPGLLFFCGMLWSTFALLRAVVRGAARAGARDSPPPALAHALMMGVAAFVVGSLFLSLAYQGMIYTLAALGAALWKVTSHPRLAPAGAASVPTVPARRRRWA